MQEFFMDYGLWLLIGLLVLIGLVFLLSGRGKAAQGDTPVAATPPPPAPRTDIVPEPVAIEPAPSVAAPVAPVIIAPTLIEPTTAQPPIPVAPTVAPAPVSPAATAAPGGQDDLLRLKGVGPKLNALLIDLGITRYADIAAWTDADIAAIDGKLGNFRGRPVRDHWVDQAKYLAAGDIAGFEAKYGKL